MDEGVASRSAERSFYCHLCHLEIVPLHTPSGPQCGSCQESFVEQLEGGDQSALAPGRFLSGLLSTVAGMGNDSAGEEQGLFEAAEHGRAYGQQGSIDLPVRNLADYIAAAFTTPPTSANGPSTAADSNDVRPEAASQANPLLRLFSMFGASVEAGQGLQFVFGMPDRMGDYASERGLEDIINEMFEQAQGSGATVPAPPEMIEALPKVSITEELQASLSDCAICKEEFAVQDEATTLTCNHTFHGECIVPWLQRSATCPVCRYQLVDATQRPNTAARAEDAPDNANALPSPLLETSRAAFPPHALVRLFAQTLGVRNAPVDRDREPPDEDDLD